MMDQERKQRSTARQDCLMQLPTSLRLFLLTLLLALPIASLNAPPASARFLQPDTWNPWLQGVDINRYAYGGNDPINNSDPNGHENFFGVDSYTFDNYQSKAAAKEVSPYAETDFNADIDNIHTSAGIAFGGASTIGATTLAIDAAPVGAIVAGGLAIAKKELKNFKFEGPAVGFKRYGNGRIAQIRYRGQTLVVRLDYERMKKSGLANRLHVNVQIAGKNYHISLDPRTLTDGKKKSLIEKIKDALRDKKIETNRLSESSETAK